MLENARIMCEGGCDELIALFYFSVEVWVWWLVWLLPPSAGWQLASLIAAIMTNILALDQVIHYFIFSSRQPVICFAWSTNSRLW